MEQSTVPVEMLQKLNQMVQLPKIYVEGVMKTNAIGVNKSAVVTNGNAVFNLTDTEGNAIYLEEVYLTTAHLWSNQQGVFNYGTMTLSADRKTLSIPITKLALNLGALAFTMAPNGLTVYLTIIGK